jgi:ATP-binding cassette, subfamily F, member 3
LAPGFYFDTQVDDMLTVNSISKTFGTQTILKEVSFTINSGDRLGLVGVNGCGKSTLLRILAALERPDSGSVTLSPVSTRMGYLPQGFGLLGSQTVGEYLDSINGGQEQMASRLEELAGLLALSPDDAVLQADYDQILDAMNMAGKNAKRAEQILPALGLDNIERQQVMATLSGGQKTRFTLANVLITAPQLLLLDEPTNHLDLEMLAWLETWLLSQEAAMLVVSHDRVFLDHITDGILDLDDQTHRLKYYAGNFSDYMLQKQSEWDHHWQQYQEQQMEIVRLKRAAERVRSRAQDHKDGKIYKDNDTFSRGFFHDRALETMRRSKNIEKRVEQLKTDDKIEKPRQNWQLKIGFEDIPSSGRDVLVFEDLAVGYGKKVLLESLNTTIRFGDRIVLVGSNGSGKTSLLKTILGEISPLAGSYKMGSRVIPGYMAQELAGIDFQKDAFTTIASLTSYSETEVRRFLSYYLFTGDEVFTPVDKLSFGERARLSLACLIVQGCNFLLLDEPTNHLDIPSRMRFEQALELFEGTLLIISHDRYFIEQFASEIWDIRERRIVKTILEM